MNATSHHPTRHRASQLCIVVVSIMMLAGCGSHAKPTAPAPSPGAVFVRSTPLEAQISLDGVSTGTLTPNGLPSLSRAQHTLRLHMVGYADSTFTFTTPAGTPETLAVALRPLLGTPRSFAIWQDMRVVEGHNGGVTGIAAGPGGTMYATTFASFFVFSSAGGVVTHAFLPYDDFVAGLTVNSHGEAYFGQVE
jgi:hypothetical protein